jgi:ribosomal protein L30/L7E
MHLSLALFRQRASAAALYPPLAQLMQALGLKRLSHGVVIDKTYANGELTHEGKGIRKHALEAGLADGSICSFNLGHGLVNAPDAVMAYVNDARHAGACVHLHVPLALLGLAEHGQPLAWQALNDRVHELLRDLLLLAQPECGWQMRTPNAAKGILATLPAADASPPSSQQAPQADLHTKANLGQRLQALLGADALQTVSPTLTRVAVPEALLNTVNDTLGQEGRLACWQAPRVRKARIP